MIFWPLGANLGKACVNQSPVQELRGDTAPSLMGLFILNVHRCVQCTQVTPVPNRSRASVQKPNTQHL